MGHKKVPTKLQDAILKKHHSGEGSKKISKSLGVPLDTVKAIIKKKKKRIVQVPKNIWKLRKELIVEATKKATTMCNYRTELQEERPADMAKVETPRKKVAKAPVQTRHKESSSHKAKNIYCILCRRSYVRHEAQEHMHGMLHHRELETVLGKGTFHECQACKESSMGLNEYAQHISTAQHKAKLKSLITRNMKPLSLMKTLSTEMVDQILERNKMLKKEEKKAVKKKKKKLKQVAGKMRAEMLQGQNTVMSRVVIPKQGNSKTLNHMLETHQEGGNKSVVQNKENKVSSLRRPPNERESSLQHHGGRLAYWSGEPAGRPSQHPHVRDQCTQSAQQIMYEDKFFVNSQFHTVKVESSKTGRPITPHITQGDSTNKSRQKTRPYDTGYDSAVDFTSDHLPPNGAIIFHQGKNEDAGQEGSRHSAQPAPATGPSAAPIQDVDVGAMLRQIRRALGVREPCRADREARKHSSEAGVRLADHAGAETEQAAGGSFRNHSKAGALRFTSAAAMSQSSQVSSPAPASRYGLRPPSISSKAKQGAVKVAQGATEHCEKSSQSNNGGPPDNRASRCLGRTASSEHNITHKVRIAHKSSKVQGEKTPGLKPTLNKLLSLSGTKSKLSWKEMHEEMRRKKQESLKGKPRFGIEFSNSPSDQERSAQAEDLPLSEGFHWESLPGSPLRAVCAELLPRTQDTTHDYSRTETQSDAQMQQPSEQPGAPPQEGCSSQMVTGVTVKVEPASQNEYGEWRDNSSAKKRTYKMFTDDGISDNESRGKKKKTKLNKDQDQMDQLLAVSLREEELSHSLQDLDLSLIQARNALQNAYTEVQRLLLLRQQCTAEVNGLRAKRIEILQGMQGGFSGASNVTEKATTPLTGAAAVAAAAMQPRQSPLPSSSTFSTSSSQQPPPTNVTASISQPHSASLVLSTMPVQRDMHQPLTCNPDAHQLPVNQHLPLFPSNFPPLLISTPHLAAPTTAVTSLKQLGSTSAVPSPELPARQEEKVIKEGLKDPVKLRDEADSSSVEETGGNPGPAAEPVSIFVPERERNTSAASPDDDDDDGNESDDSVKMVEPSDLVVINIDESDNETVSSVPVHQDPPQKSVSVEFSSADTQQRKVQPTPVNDETVEVVEDEEPYLGAFENHTGPVHGLQIHGGLLYTCSGDNTARVYSLMNRECQAVFKGHTNKINCLLVSSLPNMVPCLYTGSSDQTIRCYSIKSRKFLQQITLPDRVLCLHIGWNILFVGLANGSVASYDLKTLKQLDVFECHGPRGVSCLGTAQEGARRVLLVGSYDSTISVRDAKSGLLLRSLEGHTKTVLCMKVVNDLVFSGSSDTSVHAHNIHTGELVRIYKGHGHAVTSIVILGKVMVTACLDKLVRVYEFQSHDRLQVYGGHSDMVMCMAIHKSVIYTGCYDGSVQAVKLNLMKNYRCWWQNCSLIFGVAEHLVQHLVGDHTNPNLQTVKCRWKSCSKFFGGLQSVREELPEHMQHHVDKDGNVQP